jgi:hypothetical protein
MKTFKQFLTEGHKAERDAKYAEAVNTKNTKQQQKLVDYAILASGGFADYKGRRIYTGAYDHLDGEILEAIPYSQMSQHNSHSEYLSRKSAVQVNSGNAGLFIVDNRGVSTWRDRDDGRGIDPLVSRRVSQQLQLVDRSPITKDNAGNVIPLSKRFEDSDDNI